MRRDNIHILVAPFVVGSKGRCFGFEHPRAGLSEFGDTLLDTGHVSASNGELVVKKKKGGEREGEKKRRGARTPRQVARVLVFKDDKPPVPIKSREGLFTGIAVRSDV